MPDDFAKKMRGAHGFEDLFSGDPHDPHAYSCKSFLNKCLNKLGTKKTKEIITKLIDYKRGGEIPASDAECYLLGADGVPVLLDSLSAEDKANADKAADPKNWKLLYDELDAPAKEKCDKMLDKALDNLTGLASDYIAELDCNSLAELFRALKQQYARESATTNHRRIVKVITEVYDYDESLSPKSQANKMAQYAQGKLSEARKIDKIGQEGQDEMAKSGLINGLPHMPGWTEKKAELLDSSTLTFQQATAKCVTYSEAKASEKDDPATQARAAQMASDIVNRQRDTDRAKSARQAVGSSGKSVKQLEKELGDKSNALETAKAALKASNNKGGLRYSGGQRETPEVKPQCGKCWYNGHKTNECNATQAQIKDRQALVTSQKGGGKGGGGGSGKFVRKGGKKGGKGGRY